MPKGTKSEQRIRRHVRVRKTVRGTAQRPRLSVYRTEKHIGAQIVDDQAGCTLVAVTSLNKELRAQFKRGSNRASARVVGKWIAERAKEKGIGAVVFDRGGYLYHGRVKELAEGAREGGLKF